MIEPAVKPLLEAREIAKYFGKVIALEDVSITVDAGAVTCLLGDNGAGKSTLIKVLSGFHRPDSGRILMDGAEVRFSTPRDAKAKGISTLYQDLAVMPLMSVARNFVLGSEPTKRVGPFRLYDGAAADEITRGEMSRIGIELRDTNQAAGTLSGGEQQALAIARAERYGARVLILDEPTSALGVGEAATVLKHILVARSHGLGVVLITHNVQHAMPVGDKFLVLSHGRVAGTFARGEIDAGELFRLMGGGDRLDRVERDLELVRSNLAQK
jgi:simple sugar transport system ATP-binding protein